MNVYFGVCSKCLPILFYSAHSCVRKVFLFPCYIREKLNLRVLKYLVSNWLEIWTQILLTWKPESLTVALDFSICKEPWTFVILFSFKCFLDQCKGFAYFSESFTERWIPLVSPKLVFDICSGVRHSILWFLDIIMLK